MSDQIINVLREQLAAAEADAKRLRAAIAIMENGSADTSKAAPDASARTAQKTQPTARPPRRATSPRASRAVAVPLGKILQTLTEHPGQTTTQLASLTGGVAPKLLRLLKEAESAGDVCREGERRGTRWWTVTDEDRIAARAKVPAVSSRGKRATRS